MIDKDRITKHKAMVADALFGVNMDVDPKLREVCTAYVLDVMDFMYSLGYEHAKKELEEDGRTVKGM